jgi:hypothetical protein
LVHLCFLQGDILLLQLLLWQVGRVGGVVIIADVDGESQPLPRCHGLRLLLHLTLAMLIGRHSLEKRERERERERE